MIFSIAAAESAASESAEISETVAGVVFGSMALMAGGAAGAGLRRPRGFLT
jgi:hypothetical protein